MGAAPLLDIRDLRKSFPGVRALDGVSVTIKAGEIHALLGENGAGKSTLINIITGALRHDGGTLMFEGRAIAPRTPAQAEAAGIAAVHQEVPLLPNLSVAENILLGREPSRFGLIDAKAMNARAKQAMARLGQDIDVARPLAAYSLAVQQLVAIARALDHKARLLVLDEPTASLDAAEVETLFGVMRELRASGVGIIFITHFLEQVFAIADTITVLRNGAHVTTRPANTLTRADIVSAMLGRDLTESMAPRAPLRPSDAAPLVTARNLSGRACAPFSLEFYPGEVTGAAGLLGSGRTETALVLFGADPATSGVLEIRTRSVHIASPRAAVRAGFGLLAEDRKRDGVFASLSVRENIIIALQARRGWLKPLSRTAQNQIADRFIRLIDIRTPDAEKPIGQLSGGNQQKALLARWLATEPLLMILDEPTRGVDVGAHAEILGLIAAMRAQGMAVYVISSEIKELIAVAHRVSVMRDRAQVRMLEGEALTGPAIMAAIAEAAESQP